MSEEIVIFLEEICSSQADNKSAVQAAFPPSPFAVPEKIAGEREARRVLWEVQRDQLKYAVCARQRRALRQMLRTKMRTLMLLVALTRLGSLDTSLRDSRSQRSFVQRDWRRRRCPRVSLTPLTHPPQCESSNLHHLPLPVLLEFLG